MQKAVRDFEGGEYVPERYMRPESVAGVVKAAIETPRDAHVHEIVIRQPNR
jgi:hypothetical protein